LIIPFTILWKVRVSWRKKIVLAGIFSLTIFIVVCTILRVVLVQQKSVNGAIDVSWLFLWNKVELDTGKSHVISPNFFFLTYADIDLA
jgi:hypothetical protein